MNSSRFSIVSRRAFLGGMSATAILGLAACSSDDATLEGTSGSASGTQTKSASTATGPALGSAASADIAFTFASSSNGPAKNPYIAVWIEDSAGNLVKTVSLWHLQQNDRWLKDLTRWYEVSGGDDTGSSATRSAGSYAVQWDGTDANGSKVAGGDYYLCIESAVEQGNYSLVREVVSFGDKAFNQSLADNGDLSAITVTYSV